MFERESMLAANMIGYCRMLTADLAEDQLSAQPAPGINTPLWIMGHLAVTADSGLEILGQAKLCPGSWRPVFQTGTLPPDVPLPHPTKSELLGTLERGYDLLARATRTTSQAVLDSADPVPFLRRPLPTVGDLLAHLLTTHPGIHLGQLSTWRRLMGLPAVLGEA